MAGGCKWKPAAVFGLSLLASIPPSASCGTLTAGIKGGLASATLRSDPGSIRYVYKTGFTGGAFVVYPVAGRLSLQAEVLYVPRGASLGKIEARGPSGEDLGTFEAFHVLDDLDFGVRARLAPVSGGKIEPYLFVGPALAVKLKERITTTFGQGTSERVDQLDDIGLGLTLGAGGDTKLGPGRWLLEASYDLGLSDIGRQFFTDNLHTSTWRFQTGYGIR